MLSVNMTTFYVTISEDFKRGILYLNGMTAIEEIVKKEIGEMTVNGFMMRYYQYNIF